MKNIYCDGACQPNPGHMGAGIYVPEVCSVSLYLGNGTNQRAELIALTKAIEMAEDGDTIYTDSRYALGMAGNWKAKTNTELVIALRAALRDKRIALKWVRGHEGNSAQGMADSLAVEAINKTGVTVQRRDSTKV